MTITRNEIVEYLKKIKLINYSLRSSIDGKGFWLKVRDQGLSYFIDKNQDIEFFKDTHKYIFWM